MNTPVEVVLHVRAWGGWKTNVWRHHEWALTLVYPSYISSVLPQTLAVESLMHESILLSRCVFLWSVQRDKYLINKCPKRSNNIMGWWPLHIKLVGIFFCIVHIGNWAENCLNGKIHNVRKTPIIYYGDKSRSCHIISKYVPDTSFLAWKFDTSGHKLSFKW